MIVERFKTSFAKNIFRSKYAQGPEDTWDALADRVVEDVCGSRHGTDRPLLSREDRRDLVELIRNFKFVPGGRYLYYGGRPFKAYNNCGVSETKLLTDKGWVTFGEVVDQEVNVFSPVDGKYKSAIIHAHGIQPVYEYTFKSVRGKSEEIYKVRFTEDHKWKLINGNTTENLSIGDVVPANTFSLDKNDEAFAHGFVFGDGNINGQLRLCAEKDLAYLERLSRVATTVSYPAYSNGDPCLYFKQGKGKWKDLPETTDPEYIASFIMGWIAADGSKDRMLCSVNLKALQWFRNYAPYAGLVITGKLRHQDRNVSIGKYTYNNHRIYIQNWSRGSSWLGFKVIKKEYVGKLPVFCPFEPEYNQIVIDHGMHTYNCYLLRAEEDTREEWASLSWRAMSCLMTGGGIGADYSRLRPKGSPLSRTGGVSSGPVPLMFCINEIGRNVMQGGSRRSAIYASLNWKHEDIPEFLTVKNWAEETRSAKEKDFNAAAPLDMTNISVNYDNDWLNMTNREKHPIFLQNVFQAMSTGEPGFSFNFNEKENETLRNAPLGPDTYVLTVDGYHQIRDIVDKTVKIWTGKQWANTTFRKTFENAEVVRVSMSGGREIIAEPSHEFFLEDGTKKHAIDLDEGDNLLVQLNNEVDGFECKDYYTLGYIYGDGTFHKLYPRAEVTFCTDESRDCFEGFDKSLLTSWNLSDSRGYLRAYTKNHTLFANRHKEIFPEDLLGSQSGTAQQVSFLAGLFDADGNYIEDRGMIRVASKHVNFLHGVRRLLESLGILSGVSTAGISTYGQSQGYMLTVYSEFTTRFAEIIPTRRLKIKPYTSYRKAKIKVIGVEPAGFSDVYCCDVGVEEHAFMAEGVIVSNCTEVTSADDSDVCNLGSINLGNIKTLEEFRGIVTLASKFLVCGTLRADLPYEKVYKVREKNRRLGLGLMGIHEWLLQRGYKYEVVPELHKWLEVYKYESEKAANEHCDHLFISRPIAYRAIAPTGTIGILASTTTGIEPLFAVAYKRRYLTDGTKWKYEFVVDSTADTLIKEYDLKPDNIDTAYKLSHDYERRIKFQADIQDYVDMSISSTINLPAWGTKGNTEQDVSRFSQTLARYAPRLRGFTCYPDGSRGGQPLTEVSYEEAVNHKGVIFQENDICDITGKGGSCGV